MIFGHTGRPTGRLFLLLIPALLLASSVPMRAAITKTVVHDIIYRADGSAANGTLLISWPSFRTAGNSYVAAGSTTVALGPAGEFSVELAPTDGATPAGVQYRVVLQLTGAPPDVQYWTVPATGSSGITPGQGGSSQGAGRVAPPDFGPYLLRAGDTMSGPLMLNADPIADMQATTRQYVDNAVASAKKSTNVKDFGAACNSTSDDTAAIQSAISSFHGKGGVLHIPDGCLLASSLTFPTYDNVHRGSLVIELEGALLLKATLELPQSVSLIGKGGPGMVQFQSGPAARLEPQVALDPVLLLTGGDNYVEDITIPWGVAAGVKLDGAVQTGPSAVARLRNVGVLVDGKALVINNYFWVWSRDCRFLNTGLSDTVWITNSSGTAAGKSGLIYFDDTILSGGGMRVDSQVPASNIGSVFVNRMTRENGVGPLLTLDATNGDIDTVSLAFVADADPVNVQDQVHVISATPSAGRVLGLHIAGTPLSVAGDTAKTQVFFDGNGDTRPSDTKLNEQRFFNYSVRSRVWDIENVNDDSAARVVPYASLPVNQDAASWPNGGGAWTQGVTAPDGSTQAATLTSTSGLADAQIYNASQPVAVGDWIVAGVYVKGALGALPAQPSFSFNAATQPAFEHGTNYMYLTPRGFYDSQWRLAFTYAKVTSAGSGSASYILSLRADPTHPVSYAFPFVVRIPASPDLTDAEVQRWVRSLMRNVVSGVPAASYALRAHQRLYFGNDAYLSRTAAGQLGVNGAALALSADVAAKADANTLSAHVSATATHGVSSALVGISDVQTLKNKTLDATNSVAAAAIAGNILGTASGITAKAISSDGTFAANSDANIPTERAVKTYVDAHAAGAGPISTTAGLGYFWGVSITAPASNSNTAAVAQASRVHAVQFVLPFSIRVSKLTSMIGVQSSGSEYIALYDSAKNKLLDSGAMSLNSASGLIVSANVSAITLAPGVYYLAWSASDTTGGFTIPNAANWQQFLNNGNVRIGYSSSALSAGVMPTNLGTLTWDSKSYPIVLFEP
jgi:hypothetical protein